MEANFEKIVGIRLLAHQALIQNLIRNWGLTPAELMTDLRRSQEALTSSMLASGITDAQIAVLVDEFADAISTLTARIAELGDDRPDPIG